MGDDPVDVLRNRAKLDCPPVQFMNQVHGDRVVVIDSISTHEPTADALVTQVRGIALAVMVADCIPLLLWDLAQTTVGVVHVGRRGLVNAIALKTVEIMRELGAVDLQAELGPSICGGCYEVGEDIYAEVLADHPEAASQTPKGTFALDLPQALISQLRSQGINPRESRECTVEDDNYFSYRRDGVTGRTAGLIWRN